MEIWATERRALAEVVDAAHIDPRQMAAIGITNQRETTILWDRRTGAAGPQRHRLAVPPDGPLLR